MNFILTKRWLGGTLIALALVVPSGGIAYFVKHNRYDTLCFLRALSPDVMSYSEMTEVASAGNDERSLYMQQQLIFTYSHAEWGKCLPHNDRKFYDFIEKTAEQGWLESQFFYIVMTGRLKSYSYSQVSIPDDGLDIEGSFSYLLNTAEKGHQGAQLLLSAAYAGGQWGDTFSDGACIITHFRSDPVIQQHPGYQNVMCSYTDNIVSAQSRGDSLNIGKNYALSMIWLERAVNSSQVTHDEEPVYDLAMRYRYGKYGTVRDYERALELFSDLAMKNDTRAMVQLAWMYVDGTGVRRNIETARNWMKKAMAEAPSSKDREFYQMVYNQLPNS